MSKSLVRSYAGRILLSVALLTCTGAFILSAPQHRRHHHRRKHGNKSGDPQSVQRVSRHDGDPSRRDNDDGIAFGDITARRRSNVRNSGNPSTRIRQRNANADSDSRSGAASIDEQLATITTPAEALSGNNTISPTNTPVQTALSGNNTFNVSPINSPSFDVSPTQISTSTATANATNVVTIALTQAFFFNGTNQTAGTVIRDSPSPLPLVPITGAGFAFTNSNATIADGSPVSFDKIKVAEKTVTMQNDQVTVGQEGVYEFIYVVKGVTNSTNAPLIFELSATADGTSFPLGSEYAVSSGQDGLTSLIGTAQAYLAAGTTVRVMNRSGCAVELRSLGVASGNPSTSASLTVKLVSPKIPSQE
jgi:hypothetical protein